MSHPGTSSASPHSHGAQKSISRQPIRIQGYGRTHRAIAFGLRLKKPRRVILPLSAEQVAKFWASFHTFRDLAVVGLMLLDGLRSCEILTVVLANLEVADKDVSSTMIGGGDFTFAGNGTFVYLAGRASLRTYPISWVENGGKTAQPLHAPPGRYHTPRFSPDGKRLAFAVATATGRDLWVKDLERDTTSRLSFLPGANDFPVWTSDGKSIVFRSSNPAAPGLYAIRSDGSGEVKRLTAGKDAAIPGSFSPDGKRLAIGQSGDGGNTDIFTVLVEVDAGPVGPGLRLGKAELFLGTPFAEFAPAFSPDGRWLAYQSNESGTVEIHVRPFPGPGGRWQVSTGGGSSPQWSRDGRELPFLTRERRVMAADYTAKGDTFAAGKPRVCSETHLSNLGFTGYDLAADGKRLAAFLADETEAGKLPTSLTVLVNFGDELRRKAPMGK